jgi:hypothetical protein
MNARVTDPAWQAASELAVERNLRSRAEQKETEERNERIAVHAQLLAMQQAHIAEVQGLKVRPRSAMDSSLFPRTPVQREMSRPSPAPLPEAETVAVMSG